MRSIHLLFLLVLLLVLNTSCSYFSKSSDNELFYTVESNSLNIRKSDNTKSEILGVLLKGDTIIPTHDYIEWVEFDYNNSKGYVNVKYLTVHNIPDKAKFSNIQLDNTEPQVYGYLDEYVNWRTWEFWVIALVLTVVFIIFYKIDIGLWGRAISSFGVEQYFAFMGILFSVIYIFWKEDFYQSLFVTKFWWIPSSTFWIPWFLWLLSIVGILSILIFWIKNIYDRGISGVIRSIYDTLVAIISFLTVFYWVNAFVAFVVVLICVLIFLI